MHTKQLAALLFTLMAFGNCAYADLPSQCIAPNGFPYSYYPSMSKCIDGHIYDKDQELCEVPGMGKRPYWPSTQKCVDGHIYDKAQEICDVVGMGKMPYYASTQKCVGGHIYDKYQEVCNVKGMGPTPYYPTSQSCCNGQLIGRAGACPSVAINLEKEPPLKPAYTCPVIQPQNPKQGTSLIDYYTQYLGPVVSYSSALLEGGTSIKGALTNPNDIYAILDKQYEILKGVTEKAGDFAEFNAAVKGSYQNANTIANMNTKSVSNILGPSGSQNSIITMLKNGTACVAGSKSNPMDYDLNLYAVKQDDCIRLIRYQQAGSAKQILVNNKPVKSAAESCVQDIRGERDWRNAFGLMRDLGLNQITLTYHGGAN